MKYNLLQKISDQKIHSAYIFNRVCYLQIDNILCRKITRNAEQLS